MELNGPQTKSKSVNISEPTSTFQETILKTQEFANSYKQLHNALSAKVSAIKSTTEEILNEYAAN